MKATLTTGFTGGTLAGAATVGATALSRLAGLIGPKDFPPTQTWQAAFGGSRPQAAALGSAMFAAGGGAWGALFAASVEDPTPLKGALFGLLPLLYEGTVVASIMRKPLFFGGKLLPNALGFVGNCLIWGTMTGWYCKRHTTPADRTP